MDQKILALDIATKTGWATATSSGTWDLKPNRGESEGMRVVRFKAKVRELLKLEEITVVVYERPAGIHKSSIMVASEMIGVLKDLCEEQKVHYASYSAKEIKKHATGNGNSNKEKMIAAAVLKFPNTTILDDNHADALWLYDLFKIEINK